jgi:hypothetical protein
LSPRKRRWRMSRELDLVPRHRRRAIAHGSPLRHFQRNWLRMGWRSYASGGAHASRAQFPTSRRKPVFGETPNTTRGDAYAPQTHRRRQHFGKLNFTASPPFPPDRALRSPAGSPRALDRAAAPPHSSPRPRGQEARRRKSKRAPGVGPSGRRVGSSACPGS